MLEFLKAHWVEIGTFIAGLLVNIEAIFPSIKDNVIYKILNGLLGLVLPKKAPAAELPKQ